ncbi:MAG TPA: aroma-sacti cluster domain-containing protein [Thermoanaerobaculia bacterium]|nr:aroma-sacti cluster domain-containing protein [Thermoanaerobaculia bacterium]
MAGNSEKSANHKALVDAGVIKDDATLNAAEDHVIENLSKEELDTLISIRKRLSEAEASRATASTGEFETSSNIIV